MTHLNDTLSPTVARLTDVAILDCPASVRIDPLPLTTLFCDLGPELAEEAMYQALEEIARRLNELHAARCLCAFSEMPVPALGLANVAEKIGLTDVTVAARGVGDAATQGDAIAVEATLQRLERCYDSALSRIWDVEPVTAS